MTAKGQSIVFHPMHRLGLALTRHLSGPRSGGMHFGTPHVNLPEASLQLADVLLFDGSSRIRMGVGSLA